MVRKKAKTFMIEGMRGTCKREFGRASPPVCASIEWASAGLDEAELGYDGFDGVVFLLEHGREGES